MKKHIFPLLLLAATSVFTACGSMQSFTFDQLYPADITYPDQVKNVAVVNNMAEIPTPKDDLLTIGLLEGDGKVAAETLAEALADSRYFNQVIICDSALRTKDELPSDYSALTQAEVESLASSLGADMIFSVERVLLQTNRREVFYPELPMPFEAVELKTTPLIKIYIPSRSKPMAVVSKTDSLYWDITPDLSDKRIVTDGTMDAITTLVPYLIPHWGQVTRLYYTGGSVEMRDAVICLRENDWKEARRLWQQLYDNRKKGSAKMKAAFNIALSFEMEGDIDQAIEWLGKAKQLVGSGSEDRQVIAYYEEALQKKKLDLPKLNLQMGRF